MNAITLIGWKTGFDKIGLNKMLRDQFGYSLGDAKAAVDAVLQNHEINLWLLEVTRLLSAKN